MFLRIISPTSGFFQLVPQTLNNSPFVDLNINRKLPVVNWISQASSVRVRVGIGLEQSYSLLPQPGLFTSSALKWEKLYVKTSAVQSKLVKRLMFG